MLLLFVVMVTAIDEPCSKAVELVLSTAVADIDDAEAPVVNPDVESVSSLELVSVIIVKDVVELNSVDEALLLAGDDKINNVEFVDGTIVIMPLEDTLAVLLAAFVDGNEIPDDRLLLGNGAKLIDEFMRDINRAVLPTELLETVVPLIP